MRATQYSVVECISSMRVEEIERLGSKGCGGIDLIEIRRQGKMRQMGTSRLLRRVPVL